MKASLVFLWLACSLVQAFSQELMTPERFREIVATPGDALPLSTNITVGIPVWTNAMASIVMKYQTGKVFTENIKVTAKTIGGKYVVFAAQSEFYKQPMNSIFTYDEKASALKTYGLYGELVTVATTVCNSGKKIYAENSVYGDGFNEITVGSYSDTESFDRTLVYQNGVLFMTREVSTKPVTH
jgi:hypothetical protein